MSDVEKRPQILNDSIHVLYEGEEVTIWNHVTVTKESWVTSGSIETGHEIATGDAPGGESPDYITPDIDDQLRQLDVYPNAEVLHPDDEGVELL